MIIRLVGWLTEAGVEAPRLLAPIHYGGGHIGAGVEIQAQAQGDTPQLWCAVWADLRKD